MFAMPRSRCAILDDYQNVALKAADWSKVSGDLDIKVFNAHLGGDDKVIAALQGFDIVCAMRERTAFPRAVIEKLPALKLLITTGLRNASIDVAAANERGVVVCGTPAVGSPTAAITKKSPAPLRAGMVVHKPPIREISRVCIRCCSTPAIMNNPPVLMPWLTIWTIPPVIPCMLSAKMPSMTNPRWLTDEYATSFFTSFCFSETSAP